MPLNSSESYPSLAWEYWANFFGGDPVISAVVLIVIIAVTVIVVGNHATD